MWSASWAPSSHTPTSGSDPGALPPLTLKGLCTEKAFHQERLPHCDLQPAYDALATLPDVEVVKGVKSITGQSGVALAYVDTDHYRHELLMDPKTYDLLGTREITLRKLDNLAAGSVMDERGIMNSQVVPTLGVRPDGSGRKVIMPKPDDDPR